MTTASQGQVESFTQNSRTVAFFVMSSSMSDRAAMARAPRDRPPAARETCSLVR